MKKTHLSPNIIKSLLYKQKIATMGELKAALNTRVDMTAYRKLKELPYLKSYSDRGKYYTLEDIPAFDEYRAYTLLPHSPRSANGQKRSLRWRWLIGLPAFGAVSNVDSVTRRAPK